MLKTTIKSTVSILFLAIMISCSMFGGGSSRLKGINLDSKNANCLSEIISGVQDIISSDKSKYRQATDDKISSEVTKYLKTKGSDDAEQALYCSENSEAIIKAIAKKFLKSNTVVEQDDPAVLKCAMLFKSAFKDPADTSILTDDQAQAFASGSVAIVSTAKANGITDENEIAISCADAELLTFMSNATDAQKGKLLQTVTYFINLVNYYQDKMTDSCKDESYKLKIISNIRKNYCSVSTHSAKCNDTCTYAYDYKAGGADIDILGCFNNTFAKDTFLTSYVKVDTALSSCFQTTSGNGNFDLGNYRIFTGETYFVDMWTAAKEKIGNGWGGYGDGGDDPGYCICCGSTFEKYGEMASNPDPGYINTKVGISNTIPAGSSTAYEVFKGTGYPNVKNAQFGQLH